MYGGTTASPSLLTARSLTRLSIRASTGYISLIDHLTLPALQDLSINALHHEVPQWPGRAISELVQRSGCTLVELTLNYLVANPSEVSSLLSPLIYLKTLSLSSINTSCDLFSQSILDRLAVVEHGHFAFWPHLEDLTIRGFDGSLFGPLADVAVQRSGLKGEARPGLGSLRKVNFCWSTPSPKHLVTTRSSELTSLRQQGMSVRLFCLADNGAVATTL